MNKSLETIFSANAYLQQAKKHVKILQSITCGPNLKINEKLINNTITQINTYLTLACCLDSKPYNYKDIGTSNKEMSDIYNLVNAP